MLPGQEENLAAQGTALASRKTAGSESDLTYTITTPRTIGMASRCFLREHLRMSSKIELSQKRKGSPGQVPPSAPTPKRVSVALDLVIFFRKNRNF